MSEGTPAAGAGSTPSGDAPAVGTGEGASSPPGGTPAGEPAELTWESLKDQGIEKPEDVVKALQQRDSWKGHARTWETRAEQTARELQEAKKGQLSDEEKKIADAKEEARREVMGTVGVQLAEAAFTRAATGRVASVDDALELLAPAERDGTRPDLKRYLKDDGTVNGPAIEAAVERLAKLAPSAPGKTPAPGVDRGPRTGGRPTQLTRADLQRLEREGKQEEIMKAQREGQLDDLLSGKQRS